MRLQLDTVVAAQEWKYLYTSTSEVIVIVGSDLRGPEEIMPRGDSYRLIVV